MGSTTGWWPLPWLLISSWALFKMQQKHVQLNVSVNDHGSISSGTSCQHALTFFDIIHHDTLDLDSWRHSSFQDTFFWMDFPYFSGWHSENQCSTSDVWLVVCRQRRFRQTWGFMKLSSPCLGAKNVSCPPSRLLNYVKFIPKYIYIYDLYYVCHRPCNDWKPFIVKVQTYSRD